MPRTAADTNLLTLSLSCFLLLYRNHSKDQRSRIASIWALTCAGTTEVRNLTLLFRLSRQYLLPIAAVMSNLLTFSLISFLLLYRNHSRTERSTVATFQAQGCAVISDVCALCQFILFPSILSLWGRHDGPQLIFASFHLLGVLF